MFLLLLLLLHLFGWEDWVCFGGWDGIVVCQLFNPIGWLGSEFLRKGKEECLKLWIENEIC